MHWSPLPRSWRRVQVKLMNMLQEYSLISPWILVCLIGRASLKILRPCVLWWYCLVMELYKSNKLWATLSTNSFIMSIFYYNQLSLCWSQFFLKLITEQLATMLEEALPLLYKLFTHILGGSHHITRTQATLTTWLKIMASKSTLNQQRATFILYALCYCDLEYCQQTRECETYEQITQFTLPFRSRHILIELLNSNIPNNTYLIRKEIPFLKKDW